MKPIIKVENLSKQYRLGNIGTGTLSNDLKRWWYRMQGKEDPFLLIGESNDRSNKGKSEYVWALKDINFEVMPGEILGIIGKNGAGKSTLLKILSKVTGPTTGRIDYNGRIGSLLEVGTGFHPELTGRENIFLNGAILGMTKTEIKSKLDEIVDFSGCERYIHTPVKRYSSGMMVRLGFAVAAHLEPEILVVDEVLAVGDAEFQKKAIGKMQDVSRNEGRTVLFVSHNMSAMKALCSSCLLIDKGAVKSKGSVTEIIDQYFSTERKSISNLWTSKENQDSPIHVERIIQMQTENQLILTFTYKSITNHKNCFIAVDISNFERISIMQALPTIDKIVNFTKTPRDVTVIIELPPLIPGDYYTSLWIGSHNTETIVQINYCTCFSIVRSPSIGRSFPHSTEHGYIVPKSRVELDSYRFSIH